LAKNGPGRSKDAGANDRPDEEKQKIAEAKCAKKRWHESSAAILSQQLGGIITGVGEGSMESYGGRCRLGITYEDGGQHETEEEDDECEKGAEAANGIEWHWVVNGRDTKESHSKKHGAPEVPGLPEMKQAQADESKRYE